MEAQKDQQPTPEAEAAAPEQMTTSAPVEEENKEENKEVDF
jgi:hypothetical protein